MNIQGLLEQYGHLNRLIGDCRACTIRSALGTKRYKDAKWALDRYKSELSKVEDQLEDMGLLHFSDRYTDREHV